MIGPEFYILIGALNGFRVFLKALQTIHVTGGHYWAIWPTSQGMGMMEVLAWASPGIVAIEHGFFSWQLLVLGAVLGFGGALGSVLAMKLRGVKPCDSSD